MENHSQRDRIFLLYGKAAFHAQLLEESFVQLLLDSKWTADAMPVAEIQEPDDTVLEAILRKHFTELSLRPPDDLIPYLLRRMERTAPAARDIVMALDELADLSQRPISRLLAKQILEKDAENIDLFE